jgi:hypothetical protein
MAVEPIDLRGLKRFSIAERRSLVTFKHVAVPTVNEKDFVGAASMIADADAAVGIDRLAHRLTDAVRRHAPVALGMGAHAIKLGLGAYIVDLIQRSATTAVAMNGAAAFHDLELALYGVTSEDVATSLAAGRFGMAEESADAFNEAARQAHGSSRGLGECLAEFVASHAANERAGGSILAACHRLGVPVTVHLSIGTDVTNMHPSADGAALGASSHFDFRRFCSVVAGLSVGVYINLGSAVVMPEVFLKAVAVAINLGADLSGMTTANLDMLGHYRPSENVIRRMPGEGIDIRGRHEETLPALHACVLAGLSAPEDGTGGPHS